MFLNVAFSILKMIVKIIFLMAVLKNVVGLYLFGLKNPSCCQKINKK